MPILKKPLIETHQNIGEGLVNIRREGDNIVCTHREDITPVLKKAQEIREHSDDGWTKGRKFRQIGSIPASVYFNHPEFAEDRKAVVKFLKSDAGAPYRTYRKGV